MLLFVLFGLIRGLGMIDLRTSFEETDTFLYFDEKFRVYYTNLGGYHFVLDDEPCFYLNGAFTMFQELNK